MFKSEFNRFVCAGDSIECDVDGYNAVATLHYDDDTTSPDKRSDGFWPSLDPKSDGYIGPRSKATLRRHMRHATEVLESWRRDEWHYYGVAVTVWKGSIQLTDTYAHAVWGIEGNYPQRSGAKRNPNLYFRTVANDLLGEAIEDAKKKVAALCK